MNRLPFALTLSRLASEATATKWFAAAAFAFGVGLVSAGHIRGQEDPVPGLIEKLRQKDAAVRIKAAEALMQLGPAGKDAVPALVDALQDDSPVVRQKAVIALGLIHAGADGAVPALRKALKDRGAVPEKEGTSIPQAAVIA